MNVSFVLYNAKREVSPVRAVVSYAGKRFAIPAGVSVRVEMFSRKKQRCKACPEASAVNNRLDAVEAAMKNAVVYFKRDFKVPTAEEFRKKVELFLKGDNAIEIKRKEGRLVAYAEEFTERCGKSAVTKRGYMTAVNLLKKFEEATGRELSFGDVTMKFAGELKAFLEDRGYSKNYVGTVFKELRVFMREARVVDRLHDNTEYEGFKVESEVADTVYLTDEELRRVHELVIDEEAVRSLGGDTRAQNVARKIAALDVARKKFLIGAYTGLRVSDFNRVQEYNVQNGVIVILPKKGSSIRKPEPVRIPMHPVVREILEGGFDLNCRVAEQKINKHIKEVCRLAGIRDRVVLYRTEGGQVVEHVMEKWEAVSTHTARRSAATNLYKQGIPRKSIMLLTGHKTEAQFEKYIKLSAEENAEILGKHSYFRGAGDVEIQDVGVEWVRARMEERKMTVGYVAGLLGVAADELRRVLDGKELEGWERAALFWVLK